MRRLLNLLVSLPLWLAGLALFAMMWLTFADVILRGAANAPIRGASEVTEILLASVVFLALPATSLRGQHIAVDLLDGFFAPMALRLRDALVQIICAGLLLWPAIFIWEHGIRALGYGERTLYLGVPTGAITLGVACGAVAGAAAMALRGALILVNPAMLAQEAEQ